MICSQADVPTSIGYVDPLVTPMPTNPGYSPIQVTPDVFDEPTIVVGTLPVYTGITQTATIAPEPTQEVSTIHLSKPAMTNDVCIQGATAITIQLNGKKIVVHTLTDPTLLEDYINELDKFDVNPMILYEPDGVMLKTGQMQTTSSGTKYMGYVPDENAAFNNINAIGQAGNTFVYIKHTAEGHVGPEPVMRTLEPEFAKFAVHAQRQINEAVVDALAQNVRFANYVGSGILVFQSNSGSAANGLAIKHKSDSDIFIVVNLPPGESPIIAMEVADFFTDLKVQRLIAEQANVVDSGLTHISLLVAIVNQDRQTVFDTLHIDIPLDSGQLYTDRPDQKFSAYNNDCLGG